MQMKKRLLLLVMCLTITCSLDSAAGCIPVKAATVTASVTGKKTEKEIFSFLTNQMGLNSAAACGILANIYRECHFNETLSTSNSGGICMWYGDNYTRFKTFCKKKGYSKTALGSQLYFLKADLETAYFKKKVLKPLKAVPNTKEGAYKAANLFCCNYERPSNYQSAGKSRGSLAKNTYWPVYGKKTLKLPVPSCGHKHSLKTVTVKASMTKDGSVKKICKTCKETVSVTKTAHIKSVSLKTSRFTYTGRKILLKVLVKDANGKVLPSSAYKISYKGSRKNVGNPSLLITFKGKYEGKKRLYYEIYPKKTSVSSITLKDPGMMIRWKKVSGQISGYELQIARDAAFTKAEKHYYLKKSINYKRLYKPDHAYVYYVRVRSYKDVTVNGSKKRMYSDWSAVKTSAKAA